ncbi:MAG: Nif3-like dinuclear metal center hexameric protein [Planctomycetaceae bacterium]|nr:Nif3-like dinuclear metal center hexameric protein [Planctomycetaceae bacterium]
MKIKDFLEHFLAQADWVNREHTVDRIIAGDGEADADRCLVTWMPSFVHVREAARQGVKLLVAHEPTFYCHHDDRPEIHPPEYKIVQEKLAFIKDSGLNIVRLHDTWDRWPAVGIPWAWGQFLQLGDKPVAFGADGYLHRHDITPTTLGAFAARVAKRCATIGEPRVQVTGDLQQTVSKIGVGTGCGCDINTYRSMGCDCSVVCDDGSCYWSGIQMARDDGHPVIRVNHGTSEEPGMVTLTRWINEHLPVKATHLPHGCMFELVG